MESTGAYGLNLALFLHEEGPHASVVKPIRIKELMKSELMWTKNDKADVYAIATFGEEKRAGAWFLASSVAHQDTIQQIKRLRAVHGY